MDFFPQKLTSDNKNTFDFFCQNTSSKMCHFDMDTDYVRFFIIASYLLHECSFKIIMSYRYIRSLRVSFGMRSTIRIRAI